MKKRIYTEIKAVVNHDETITLNHLIGEETIPCSGGTYVIPIPCGCGKSLSITSLISQVAEDGVLLVEKSNDECYKTKEDLVRDGVDSKDIAIVYMGSSEHSIMQNNPEQISTYKVLIMPSLHLYITYLPAILAYGKGGRAVDIEKYIGDTESLLLSDEVRRFILIDEQPDFIKPFAEFSPSLATILYGVPCKENALHSVEIDPTLHLKPMTLGQVQSCYNLKLRSNEDCFIRFKPKTRVQELKAMESLYYIHKNYKEIAECDNSTMTIDHWLKDLIAKGMKTNIYLFDGTADLLSDYRKSPFALIPKSSKSYCSDIEFSEFDMGVERWLFEKGVDSEVIRERLTDTIDELERQIKMIDGKLLIITWKYMAAMPVREDEKAPKQLPIMEILGEELDKRGMNGSYTIIYRGSSLDKGTNAFASYAGVTFLGEWKVGKNSLVKLNKNFGINSKEIDTRTAAMVQNVCRVRIRQHNGDKVWVFYSSDIDKVLVSRLFNYFKEESEPSCNITGVPYSMKHERDRGFIAKVMKLCKHDYRILDAVRKANPTPITITLDDIHTLLPLKERRSRAYKPLLDKINREYNINLNITKR